MLQIYTECPKDDCIVSNDREFELKTLKKMLESKPEKYKSIISEIENVEFVGDDKIISSINGEPISILDISTGCKTIFDIAPADLSALSAEELRAHML